MRIRRLSPLGMMALALSAAGTASGTPLDPNTYGTLGTLDVPASATLVIDTGADPPQISGAGSFPGVLQSQIGGPDIAVFTFSKVNIAAGASVIIKGIRRPGASVAE